MLEEAALFPRKLSSHFLFFDFLTLLFHFMFDPDANPDQEPDTNQDPEPDTNPDPEPEYLTNPVHVPLWQKLRLFRFRFRFQFRFYNNSVYDDNLVLFCTMGTCLGKLVCTVQS
jgi:hypothetical protein